MNPIYLDNAATTCLSEEVQEEMHRTFGVVGNPSSVHSFGRKAKVLIENARKKIAILLNANPDQIIFTSGGTESNNIILNHIFHKKDIIHVITSKIEHLSVLEPINYLSSCLNKKEVHYVKLNNDGHVDLNDLEYKLKSLSGNKFVSLMHANNEIGNLLDIYRSAEICKEYNAIFHSDTVQTMGHYIFDFEKLNIDYCICSGHKLHGPKGIGFIYVGNHADLRPLMYGGSQEYGLRGGTENLPNIMGLCKALECAYRDFEKDMQYVLSLKEYFIDRVISISDSLTNIVTHSGGFSHLNFNIHNKKIMICNKPGIKFNGDCANLSNSIHTILNIKLPLTISEDLLALKLDMLGIAISTGSACTSGIHLRSHVIQEIDDTSNKDYPNIRISFSKYNTVEELDYIIESILNLSQ